MKIKDEYLWLEEVLDEKAIQWAKKISDESIVKLKSHPLFSEIENKALEFFGTKDKIPYVEIDNNMVYNLWSDDQNVQGIYRRTTIADFQNKNPSWETLIDLDQLSAEENIKWVYRGFELNDDESRALVFLSPGGSDANIMREFDLKTKLFLKDGFNLPESKGSAHWIDDNTLYIERDFGPDSVTDSGYARTVRKWTRGEPLANSEIVHEVKKGDMSAYAKIVKDGKNVFTFFGRVIDFYNYEEFLNSNGKLTQLKLPTMFEDFGIVNGQYLISLKEDWSNYKIGDILSYDLATSETKKIFSPMSNQAVYAVRRAMNCFYMILDEDVKASLFHFSKDPNNNWIQTKIDLPINGSIDFLSTDYQSDHFFVTYYSFNQPPTYYYGKGNKVISKVKTSPSFFNHEDIEVHQHFVKSLDGTKIPYFLVHKKEIKYDGTNPTILYGYGGFEIALKPSFSNGYGASWLSRGGVYVLSNIRGGGEYGPAWHQSALKENRHRAYEDFFAIAEDLISKKITSREHLGAFGGSNGGLLMGVCYTQRPDLFKAINCAVPLLDMHRYHKLLAGASWMAEYGNPDDEKDGAYIRSISPYQNIEANSKYPIMFLNTSTKDDRVHPGHARKFAAKLLENNYPVYYYENMVGGHAGASNFKESAFKHALDMSFFWMYLK